MRISLEAYQAESQQEFRQFVDEAVAPFGNDFDQQGRIPEDLIQLIGKRGYLGMNIAAEYKGRGADAITTGLLLEQVGRGSCPLLSLLTVHGMVASAIGRWGSTSQKQKWLPLLAEGKAIGAFALSEPNTGSDAKNIQTVAVLDNGFYIINGLKKWMSFGLRADLFLVFVQCGGHSGALLVERGTPGLTVNPIREITVFQAAQIASLTFDECKVPEANLIGRLGFGFSHIVNSCLDFGRYCIAWGSTGLAQACLDASLAYAEKRMQFGKALKEHQLIQAMLTEMISNVKAARLLCYNAGYLRQTADSRMLVDTAIAKYFASRTAVAAAGDAVQIHGANGFSSEYPVHRYFREAKVMEIIEGSTQIQQIMISQLN